MQTSYWQGGTNNIRTQLYLSNQTYSIESWALACTDKGDTVAQHVLSS